MAGMVRVFAADGNGIDASPFASLRSMLASDHIATTDQHPHHPAMALAGANVRPDSSRIPAQPSAHAGAAFTPAHRFAKSMTDRTEGSDCVRLNGSPRLPHDTLVVIARRETSQANDVAVFAAPNTLSYKPVRNIAVSSTSSTHGLPRKSGEALSLVYPIACRLCWRPSMTISYGK